MIGVVIGSQEITGDSSIGELGDIVPDAKFHEIEGPSPKVVEEC